MKTKKRSAVLVAASIVLLMSLFAASASSALVYRLADDAALADQADVIVHGRVVDRAVVDRDGKIVTMVAVAPHDVLKGVVVGTTIGIEVLGGELPDGRFLRIVGSPSFEVEQEVLLFLRAQDNGRFRVLHHFQGAFHSVTSDGASAWYRSIDVTASQVPVKDGFVVAEARQVRDAGRFEAWLRDRAVGTRRGIDYLVADGSVVPTIEKFTFLDTDQNQIFERWFAFDRGERVLWFRDATGQPGSPDGGASAFAAARAAWNSENATPIRYRDGGTTTSRTGFDALDGRSTILFRDYNDDIDTDFSCATGGTLAIGGVSGITAASNAQPLLWEGERFHETVEAEIIINTGVACTADDNAALAELYTHELGHTLGLGHSCGDANSPSCASDPTLASAVMRADILTPAQGAVLRADDIRGIRFLYLFNDAVSCLLDNGDGRFCSGPLCGPCNQGQGDCDDDTECAGSLVCGTNNGADFGLPPGVDVCIDAGPVGCNLANGNGRFCSDPACGPCGLGQGDCDSDAECAPGFACGTNNGAEFGFAPGIDVCFRSEIPRPGCQLDLGNGRFCSDPECGPCVAGQGDCDSDAECAGSATCGTNNGADFGFAPGVDVCIGGDGCSETLGTGRYCSTAGCGPCGEGQGDCDTDAECAAGLTCVDNIGALFGFAPGVDVCTSGTP